MSTIPEAYDASLSTQDIIIIVVMGPTGSGKSSFIEKATGTTGMAGHGLQSCTSEVSVVELEYPGVKFCFVDTPGFDNTNKSDVDILKLVGKWLGMTYRKQFRLAGLLYLHRIDDCVAGSSLKYFRFFEKLCGANFSNTVLATTMWDEVDEQVGNAHEQDLMRDFWQRMIDRGASVKRFLHTRKSAFEILSPFFAEVQERSVLHLQKEIEHCRLLQNRPSAAEALQVGLGELAARHEQILGNIQKQLRETSDPDQLRVLMGGYRTASVLLQRATKTLRTTNISKENQVRGLTIAFRLSSVFPCCRKARRVGEIEAKIEEMNVDVEGGAGGSVGIS